MHNRGQKEYKAGSTVGIDTYVVQVGRTFDMNDMNMQDLRNELDMMTIKIKIKKSHLIRIGHIARMSVERLAKQTTMGWLRRLETGRKPMKRKMTTLAYWHKLLKEANIEAQ